MSSADSFLLASGIMITEDIIKTFIIRDMSDRAMIFFTRIFVVVTGSIAFTFAININDILDSNQKEEALLFIDTSDVDFDGETHLKDSKSIVNKLEADICVQITQDYLNDGVEESDIGIISPYADQVKIIQDMTPVEVKTVDGFQGREKEIIIISTVRSNINGNIGFLKDLRRLNVAITRAKRKLIIVGNKDTLIANPTYKRLIEFCEGESLLVKI
jgi:superfamily I DNA and/or RNA helicase